MKSQKFDKKLILGKHTITNLDERQQEAVHGGALIKTTILWCGCTLYVTACDQATCCGSEWACSC